MLTLISLLDICENRHTFNEEYKGYYLAHSSDFVYFGRFASIYDERINILTHNYDSPVASYPKQRIIEYNNRTSWSSKTAFNIPTIEDVDFLSDKLSKYNLPLKCWIKDGQTFRIYDFATRDFALIFDEYTRAVGLAIRLRKIYK
jgi:hypothetical protein